MSRPRTIAAAALLMACIGLLWCSCGDETHEPARTPAWQRANRMLEKRLAAVGPALGEAGWPVDTAALGIEYRSLSLGIEPTPRDWAFDLGFTDASRRAFSRVILGIEADQQLHPSAAGYYAPWRRTIVLFRSGYGDLFFPDALVAHEAVHAYQHEARGLFTQAWYEGLGSIERDAILRCVTEGEAELGALAYLLRVRGGEMEDVQGGIAWRGFEQGTSGWFDQVPYVAGLRFLLHTREPGIRFGVDRQVDSPPTSTEQVLHPEKLGIDTPGRVRWPDTPQPAGWQLESEDCMGELESHSWIAWHLGRDTAYLACTGWDADACRVYRHAGFGRAAIWLSHWDRSEDARQFKKALGKCAPCRVHASGRTVIGFGADAKDADVLLEWVKQGVTDPPEQAVDARSTADAEDRWRQRVKAPVVDQGVWRLPTLGLSVPVPRGFRQQLVSGAYALTRPSSSGYAPHIYVDVLLLGSPLELTTATRHLTTLQQGDMLNRVIEHRVIDDAGGGKALLVEHAAGLGGVWFPMRFLSLYIPAAEGAVMVRAAVHNRDRKAVWDDVKAALSGVDHTQLAGGR